MLLAAQVPWVTCPEADQMELFPALGEHTVHNHVHHGHGHEDCDCHGHDHGHHHHGHGHTHVPASPCDTPPDVPSCECVPHMHGLLTTVLVADADAVELPAHTIAFMAQMAPLPPHVGESVVLEGAAGPEPPQNRPPSATCLEDNVRLLS